MGHGRAQVPAGDRMWRPSATHGRLFVDQDSDPGGRQWCAIEVEDSVHMSMRREMCMETTGAEQVEGLEGLWEKAIP
jgi:hypothetical protein